MLAMCQRFSANAFDFFFPHPWFLWKNCNFLLPVIVLLNISAKCIQVQVKHFAPVSPCRPRKITPLSILVACSTFTNEGPKSSFCCNQDIHSSSHGDVTLLCSAVSITWCQVWCYQRDCISSLLNLQGSISFIILCISNRTLCHQLQRN